MLRMIREEIRRMLYSDNPAIQLGLAMYLVIPVGIALSFIQSPAIGIINTLVAINIAQAFVIWDLSEKLKEALQLQEARN